MRARTGMARAALAALLLGGCASLDALDAANQALIDAANGGPPIVAFDTIRTVAAPRSQTWPVIVRWAAGENAPIPTLDERSGLLVIAATNWAPTYAQCPFDPTSPTIGRGARVTITATEQSGATTRIEVRSVFQETRSNPLLGAQLVDCPSTGEVERRLWAALSGAGPASPVGSPQR